MFIIGSQQLFPPLNITPKAEPEVSYTADRCRSASRVA